MKANILISIKKCYQAFSHFNPKLTRMVLLQTFILVLSRSSIAFFSLALSYFVNQKESITIFETIAIGVVFFYCFNRMLEWFISAIHGRIHSQFILPYALKFIDETIFLMLRNHHALNLNKNPVELAYLLNKKTDARGFLGFLFNHIATPIFEILICAILLVNLGFGWVALLLFPFIFIYLSLSLYLLPILKKKLMDVLHISAKSSSTFSSALEKANLAASFGTTDILIKHLNNITEEENKEFKRSFLLNEHMSSLLSLPLALAACLFFYLGAQQVQNGIVTYGAFAVLITVTLNSFTQLKNLTFAFDGLSNSVTALDVHLQIFEKTKHMVNKKSENLDESNFQKLQLKNLKVAQNNHTFPEINLEVIAKDKIYIVGESGVGKSSLLNALLGYKNYSGEITINDKSIDLTQHPFAWMPQAHQAIEGTVEFNLSLGNSKASRELMIEVLKNVNLLDKVISIGGLESKLEFQGNNLSGGENQRLSLARCLLSDNPILLLDEPSSALDLNLEKQIFSHIQESNKTALIIVHRLKAIPNNAKVLYIEKTHCNKVMHIKELIETNQNFAKLFNTKND